MVLFIRILVFILGLSLTILTLMSSIRTLVLSRGERDLVSAFVFTTLHRMFELRLRWSHSYESRDRAMAFFAPVALLLLPPTWLTLVLIGFMGMFWATGISSWNQAFSVSGSSLLTLGFTKVDTLPHIVLAFVEATIGLILVALLIAYLPTMYSAFSRRETAVTMLEVRAGKPPSAAQMILRIHRNNGLNRLHETWRSWELWFAEVEESHTSLSALVFFRSPQAGHSWVTAAGAILDAAALTLSTLEIPWDAQAALCIRAGYLAFRRIGDFFRLPYNPNPSYPSNDISIAREEFISVYEQMVAANVPVRPDIEQAWLDFAGWRVNYDELLLAFCRLTMAPKAPWSSDRV